MQVTSQCRRGPAPKTNDAAAVQATAAQRLHESPYFAIRGVRCEFREGVLTLRGELPTFYFKQIAQTLVADVEGVRVVHNRIQVADPSEQAR